MFSKFKIPLIIISFLIVLAAVLFLTDKISKNNFPKLNQNQENLTSQNLDSSLSQSENTLGDGLNRMDLDLKNIDQIDETADQSTGL